MRLAANLSTQFDDGPWQKRVIDAAACGFRLVEMQWPYQHIEARSLVGSLNEQGMKAILINAPVGDTEESRLGFASLPGAAPAFDQSIRAAITYAGVIGAPFIHVVAGTGHDHDAFVENLSRATSILPEGIELVIEAINRKDIPHYHLASVEDAVSVIEAVGDNRLGLMLDFYHAYRNDEPIVSLINRYAAIIKHVQVSDHPGRGEPGAGEIDFTAGLKALSQAGYTGAIGCEFRPSGDPAACMAWRDELGLSF